MVDVSAGECGCVGVDVGGWVVGGGLTEPLALAPVDPTAIMAIAFFVSKPVERVGVISTFFHFCFDFVLIMC
jgi:hypothetical protein